MPLSKRSWFVRHSQPILMAFGFMLLVVIGIAAVWLNYDAREESRRLLHTLEVENRIAMTRIGLRRAESAQRAYLLTGDKGFLTEYAGAVQTHTQSVAELRALTLDSPVQQANVSALAMAIRLRADDLEAAISLYNAGEKAMAAAMVNSEATRRRTEAIRVRTDGMSAEEQRLFRIRSADFQETSRWLLAASLTGAALIVLLAFASVQLVRLSNRARDEARRLVEENNANLELTVAERTADLREANEEIQRFAYIVSHDLRSPLVNIMGFTSELEALREDIFGQIASLRQQAAAAGLLASTAAEGGTDKHEALGRDFDEALGFIKASIGKMERLIAAILRLSREGQRQFRPETIDLAPLLGGISDSLAHQAGEADATVSIEALPKVVSDRLSLEQVFSNLLDNALKYLKKGEPGLIRVSGRTTPSQVLIEVADNGRGIDKKDHQRIFDLFRRAGEQDRPGEGIGLAHVRALVRRLGGTLTVRSELGQGSTFTVALPRRWVGEAQKEAA